jgi:hypothetical protein
MTPIQNKILSIIQERGTCTAQDLITIDLFQTRDKAYKHIEDLYRQDLVYARVGAGIEADWAIAAD